MKIDLDQRIRQIDCAPGLADEKPREDLALALVSGQAVLNGIEQKKEINRKD